MSHEIVKCIVVIYNKVMIDSAASDEWPQRFREWEAEQLSELWNTKGRRAVEMELLFCFFSGWMQANNIYAAAIKAAEEAGLIEDHHHQYMKCHEDQVYRKQFLLLLHSFLDIKKKKVQEQQQ